MDFNEQLNNAFTTLNLPIPTTIGFLNEQESASFYAMPGGQVSREFMDESKEVKLNYEYAIKSKRGDVANNQLWTVSNYLEQLEELASADGSFDFENIIITSKPVQSQPDEQGFYYWVVDFTVTLTTYKKGVTN